MNGFLNVLKPPGMTSSDVVLFVRRLLPRGVKTGHGGTLDPDAAGVLPVCVGKATRLFDYIIDKQKEYVAELRLGVETDTQDAGGAVLFRRPVAAGEAEVRAILSRFTGEILQTPPAYSALKVGGKRMYELARRGEEVALQPRPVQIHELTYLQNLGVDRHLLRVVCGKGTYIRALMSDIGAALGCGGHMAFLLRSRAGVFCARDAFALEEIAACGDLPSLLAPLDAPLAHLPRVDAPPDCERAIGNGNPVSVPGCPQGAPLRVYCAGRFAGVGVAEGDLVRFKAMLW